MADDVSPEEVGRRLAAPVVVLLTPEQTAFEVRMVVEGSTAAQILDITRHRVEVRGPLGVGPRYLWLADLTEGSLIPSSDAPDDLTRQAQAAADAWQRWSNPQ